MLTTFLMFISFALHAMIDISGGSGVRCYVLNYMCDINWVLLTPFVCWFCINVEDIFTKSHERLCQYIIMINVSLCEYVIWSMLVQTVGICWNSLFWNSFENEWWWWWWWRLIECGYVHAASACALRKWEWQNFERISKVNENYTVCYLIPVDFNNLNCVPVSCK